MAGPLGKVLIVEDNRTTREGLCENIPWKSRGIEIVAAVDDGRIDYDRLLETVCRAIEEKKHEEALLKQVIKSIPLLQKEFFRNLLRGTYDREALSEDADYPNIDLSFPRYICLVLEIDHMKEAKRKLKIEQLNICRLVIKEAMAEALGNFPHF